MTESGVATRMSCIHSKVSSTAKKQESVIHAQEKKNAVNRNELQVGLDTGLKKNGQKEQTLHKRRYKTGQHTQENVLNIISH